VTLAVFTLLTVLLAGALYLWCRLLERLNR